MLTSFNKTVLTIATIILIISLFSLGLFLSKSMQNESYPPIVSDCPDYWDVSYSNNNVTCINTSTINKGRSDRSDCNNYSVDLFASQGNDKNRIICEKYKWAKKCKIHWDGIVNNNTACNDDIY